VTLTTRITFIQAVPGCRTCCIRKRGISLCLWSNPWVFCGQTFGFSWSFTVHQQQSHSINQQSNHWWSSV